ncbi:hypothetical protein D3C86_1069360 [compost metagenome]
MNTSPARGLAVKFPRVLKKRLPEKSGMVSTLPSTRTNPGLPPRCETSTARPARGLWSTSESTAGPTSGSSTYDATKNVSDARISARAASSNWLISACAVATRNDGGREKLKSRAWMYCGQLPNDCVTATSKRWPSHAAMRPFMRLRRRVCNSIPKRPTGWPRPRPARSGSSVSGMAATLSVCGSGDTAKPGSPSSTPAQGSPCGSTDPITRKGNCAKNARCWSGM